MSVRRLELVDADAPAETAVPRSDIVILAVPDTMIKMVSVEIVKMMTPGSTLIILDPAAAVARELALRDDCTFVVTHPCHPSYFLIHLTAVSHCEPSTFSCARKEVTVMASTTNGSTDLRSLTVIIGHLLPELTMNLPQHPSLQHLHR